MKKKKVLIVFAFLVLITSYIVKIQYKMDCEKKVLEAKYRLNRIVEYQKEYYAKNRKYDVEYISVEKLKYLKKPRISRLEPMLTHNRIFRRRGVLA